MDAKENGEQGITGYATECGCSHGLTKREHFAAMAMQGFCAHPGRLVSVGLTAQLAVKYADGLLRALAARGEA